MQTAVMVNVQYDEEREKWEVETPDAIHSYFDEEWQAQMYAGNWSRDLSEAIEAQERMNKNGE